MILTLTAAAAATVFGFGTGIFYVLASLERPVLGLVVSAERVVDEDELRLTHQALLRLVPVLPPSNGIVLLAGTGLLVITGVQSDWAWPVVAALGVYWGLNAYIILGRRILDDVRALQASDSSSPMPLVRDVVRRLTVQHHLNLVANFTTSVLTLIVLV